MSQLKQVVVDESDLLQATALEIGQWLRNLFTVNDPAASPSFMAIEILPYARDGAARSVRIEPHNPLAPAL